jgi:hypothetical protein
LLLATMVKGGYMAKKQDHDPWYDMSAAEQDEIIRFRRAQEEKRHTKESYYNALIRQGYSQRQAWALVVEYYGEDE